MSTNPRRGIKRRSSSFYGQTSTGGYRRRYNAVRRMPLYRTMRRPTPYNAVYPFERNVTVFARYNPSIGFEGKGYGISFSFQQDNVLTEFGDQSVVFQPIAAATELTSLFDQWRIDKIELQCFYTRTSVEQQNVANDNSPMPMMYIVNDYDDSNVQAGTTNLAEYAQARVVQWNPIVNGIRHTCLRPGTRVDALNPGGTVRGISRRSPWCDTRAPDVVHFGIKCQAIGVPFSGPNAYVGSACFQFKIYYSYKNQR